MSVIPKKRMQRGFSLIELMIVVAIIGIIAAVAYPSYIENVKKTRRADAQGALMSFTNAMERHFMQNNSFLGAGGTTAAPLDTGAPRIFATEAPLSGTTKYYDLSITAATATSYTLSAIPKGAQAGDGRLSVDSTGNRTWNTEDDGSGTNRSW